MAVLWFLLLLGTWITECQYVALAPSSLAAGELPLDEIVTFFLPVPLGNQEQLVISFTSLTPTISGSTIPTSWAPFNPNLSLQNGINTIPQPESPLPCRFLGSTDTTGSTLTITLGNLNGNCALAGGTGGRNDEIQLIIPRWFLSTNPDYPNVLVATTMKIVTNSTTYGPFPVAVPWTTTASETAQTALSFDYLVPGSTIGGSAVQRLKVGFTPGVSVVSPGKVALMVWQSGILADSVPANAPNLVLSPDGCSTDIYCCSKSTATIVRTPLYGILSITLLPRGCMLPSYRQVIFTVDSAYLGNNPTSTSKVDTVVDTRLATSSEPYPVLISRYSNSDLGVGYINRASWVIGSSMMQQLTVAPDTLLSNQVPSFARVTVVLTTSLPTATYAYPARITLVANQGVFKSNMGTRDNQLPLGTSPATDPSPCNAGTWFSDAYSTVTITPNPTNIAACASLLLAGSKLGFTLPAGAFLPNPSAGTTVKFDAWVVPPYTIDSTNGTVPATTLVDGASLMDVNGYTTVALCGTSSAPSLQTGDLNDISGLNYEARCRLVDAIATISPSAAGILQCPGGASSLVTYAKVPDPTWTQSQWPGTNVPALGTYPQQVSVSGTPTVVLTNWGRMYSTPMFAIVVSYPPTTSSLDSIGVNSAVPKDWSLVFIIKLNRLAITCATANAGNPWQFEVSTAAQVAEVLSWFPGSAAFGSRAGPAGTPVNQVGGSAWSQGNNKVMVSLSQSALVAGYATASPSPVAPPDEGSNDALFGLLALIAIPVCLLCLIPLLLFMMLRKKPEPCCVNSGVPEVRWVNEAPMCTPMEMYSCDPAIPQYACF